MNTHELPMILFTVIAQMSVGAFVGLGIIQLLARTKFKQATIDEVTDPIVFAIGPMMVVGLIVSMFHMNDVFNVLNVFRNVGSSWLSREIVFGLLFAAFGFLFALMQWFRIGSGVLREITAGVAALFGIGLLWSMSSIYASLGVVPAWNTWVVPVQFAGTAVILGALLIAAALLVADAVRARTQPGVKVEVKETPEKTRGAFMTKMDVRFREIKAPTTDAAWKLTLRSVQGLTLAAAIAAGVVLISYSLYISDLAAAGSVGLQSAAIFSGPFFVTRLVLLVIAAIIVTFLAFRVAATATQKTARMLAILVTTAFVLAFIAELMGRSLHYDAMFRVGI